MDDYDAFVLESAGWGTEEDYGYYGQNEDWYSDSEFFYYEEDNQAEFEDAWFPEDQNPPF